MSEWQVTQDFSGAVVPPEELVSKAFVAYASSIDSIFQLDIERFRGRSYTFLLHVFARVYSYFHAKSFIRAKGKVTAVEIADAEKACIKASMHHTKPAFVEGKLKSLGAQVDEEGIISVHSRAAAEMKLHYGNDRFPILMSNDPLAFIWMQHIHIEDHSGVTRTLAKSRRKFWIVRGRRLAEKIKNSCYRCRLTDKLLAAQKMAPLPTTRTQIAPIFHSVSLDLLGPIEIHDTVKKITRKKVWGIIIDCTVTRAVHLDITEDYGTDSILMALRRFTTIRGCPGKIHSDQGSQLIAASKDIAPLVQDWDWNPIHEWAAQKQIKWTLTPAEGQHQNGLSESLIKLTKRTIKHKITGNVLSALQLQTAFYEIATIINSRPISVDSGSDPDCPSPITPNHLILGRATADVPQGHFDHEGSKNHAKRFQAIQEIVTS